MHSYLDRKLIGNIPLKTTREDNPNVQQHRFIQDMQRLHEIAAPVKSAPNHPKLRVA